MLVCQNVNWHRASLASVPVWRECLCASFRGLSVLGEFQFAKVQVCQRASFARVPVLLEYQFCQSATFPKPLVCQSDSLQKYVPFCKGSSLPSSRDLQEHYFPRLPVLARLSVCQFCLSANLAEYTSLPECQFCQRQFSVFKCFPELRRTYWK